VSAATRRGSGRRARRIVGTLIVATGVLVAIGGAAALALPRVAARVATRVLTDVPGFAGSVREVEFSPLSGRLVLRDTRVTVDVGEARARAKESERIVHAPLIVVDLDAERILRMRFTADVRVSEPRVTVREAARRELRAEARAATREASPAVAYFQGLKRNLDDALRHVPMRVRLAEAEVDDAIISLPDAFGREALDVRLDGVDARVRTVEGPRSRQVRIEARGNAPAGGRFDMTLALRPEARTPAFDGDLRVTGIDLPKANAFLRAGAGMDVTSGRLDLSMDFAADGGRFRGTARPVATDVEFVGPEDREDGLVSRLKEAIVGGAEEVAQTSEDRIDRVIPFSGEFPETVRDPWTGLRDVLAEGMTVGMQVGGRG